MFYEHPYFGFFWPIGGILVSREPKGFKYMGIWWIGYVQNSLVDCIATRRGWGGSKFNIVRWFEWKFKRLSFFLLINKVNNQEDQ
jgi:hypothetical protein